MEKILASAMRRAPEEPSSWQKVARALGSLGTPPDVPHDLSLLRYRIDYFIPTSIYPLHSILAPAPSPEASVTRGKKGTIHDAGPGHPKSNDPFLNRVKMPVWRRFILSARDHFCCSFPSQDLSQAKLPRCG